MSMCLARSFQAAKRLEGEKREGSSRSASRSRGKVMKMERLELSTGETSYFFVSVNLLVGIAILMAVISVGVMIYGGLQFIGN